MAIRGGPQCLAKPGANNRQGEERQHVLLGGNEMDRRRKGEAQGQERGGRGLVLKHLGPSLWPEALTVRARRGMLLPRTGTAGRPMGMPGSAGHLLITEQLPRFLTAAVAPALELRLPKPLVGYLNLRTLSYLLASPIFLIQATLDWVSNPRANFLDRNTHQPRLPCIHPPSKLPDRNGAPSA